MNSLESQLAEAKAEILLQNQMIDGARKAASQMMCQITALRPLEQFARATLDLLTAPEWDADTADRIAGVAMDLGLAGVDRYGCFTLTPKPSSPSSNTETQRPQN